MSIDRPRQTQPTPAQEAEIKRRLETLDRDIASGRYAAAVLADLRRRHDLKR
jgi:hypothetical protein